MFQRKSSPAIFSTLFACLTAVSLTSLSGCGVGPAATGIDSLDAGSAAMSGILHGGANPIVGATVTLYVTTSNGYGATATVCATYCTTTTGPGGFFNFTLPTTGTICPAGQYAYLGAYSGSTGATSNNANSLLMIPIGACSANYGANNVYIGPGLWIDELTTAVSAYALGNFMTVTSGGVINIGAPAKNLATASVSTPSAAGLAHAFANALALINLSTGQPNTYMDPTTSGGVIPGAEISLLGNILQACVNSTGTTSTPTATSNDGTPCGMLFSMTAAPSGVTLEGPVTALPSNTLQAMLNLAKFPIPGGHVSSSTGLQTATWNSACTGTGTANTTSACLFGISPTQAAYAGALSSAPPDWALSVVYTNGYGSQTTSCTGTCPGLTYPYYVAMDYQDNVYVLNYSALSPTWTNLIGIGNNGAPLFASPESTTYTAIQTIGTDTASHVFGFNISTSGSSTLVEYNSATSSGTYGAFTSLSVNTTSESQGTGTGPAVADPLNNIYAVSTLSTAGINMRKFGFTSPATYTVSALTTTAPTSPVLQIGFGKNLDLYMLTGPVSSATTYLMPNSGTYTEGTAAAGSYPSSAIGETVSAGGNTNAPSYGIGGTSAGNAIVFDSAGATVITKNTSTITAGTAVTIPIVPSATSGVVSRGVFVDGFDYAYSPDGAGGTVVSGVSVYDSVDGIALGTYRGCLVVSLACSTSTTAGAPTAAPMISPRGAAIDSSGDVWVVSGNSESLTELIGVAAPAWPGLSLGLRGEPR